MQAVIQKIITKNMDQLQQKLEKLSLQNKLLPKPQQQQKIETYHLHKQIQVSEQQKLVRNLQKEQMMDQTQISQKNQIVKHLKKQMRQFQSFECKNSGKRKQSNIKYMRKHNKIQKLWHCIKQMLHNSQNIHQQKIQKLINIILIIKKFDDKQKIKKKQFTSKQQVQFIENMKNKKSSVTVKQLCSLLEIDNHSFFIWVQRFQKYWRTINNKNLQTQSEELMSD